MISAFFHSAVIMSGRWICTSGKKTSRKSKGILISTTGSKYKSTQTLEKCTNPSVNFFRFELHVVIQGDLYTALVHIVHV